MRRLGFAVDYRGGNVPEARGVQESLDLDFAEAEPEVCVQLPGLLEMVLHEVEHDDPASRPQDAVCLSDGVRRMLGVVQTLTKER